jgi:DHA2 family multidrug resistance protein-like MFS transporter
MCSLPLLLSLLAGTLLAPRHMARLGARRALLASLGLALLGAVLVGVAFRSQSDLWACVALIPFAVGAGSAFPNATELVLSAVPEQRAGAAAAVSETAFELGGALGIALLGAPVWASATLPAVSAAAAGAAGALVCALVSAR